MNWFFNCIDKINYFEKLGSLWYNQKYAGISISLENCFRGFALSARPALVFGRRGKLESRLCTTGFYRSFSGFCYREGLCRRRMCLFMRIGLINSFLLPGRARAAMRGWMRGCLLTILKMIRA